VGHTTKNEKRSHFRKEMARPMEFAAPDGTRHRGLCNNFSLGGVHVEATEPAPFGSRVTIFIHVEGIAEKTVVTGVVRWMNPSTMGVQFDLFGTRTTPALIQMLADRAGET